jgi:hypothetical protein
MSNAETYQQQAEEMKRLAQLARSVEHRAILLHMADTFIRMSLETERENGR